MYTVQECISDVCPFTSLVTLYISSMKLCIYVGQALHSCLSKDWFSSSILLPFCNVLYDREKPPYTEMRRRQEGTTGNRNPGLYMYMYNSDAHKCINHQIPTAFFSKALPYKADGTSPLLYELSILHV